MKTSRTLLPLSIGALLFFIQPTVLHAQVSGCKDPAANNYNPSATVNDGSCAYPATTYTPPVKVDPISTLLPETSGLQMAGNFLWSFNDGGNRAAIYRIDTASNAVLQTVNLGGATNVDWEDIAFDGTYFYVGDFGNNATGIRKDLKIYKFPFSAIPADYLANPTVTVPSAQIEVINFSYSNQTDFSTAASNNTRFDCEAMLVDGGKVHLFTKNWIDVNTTHYVINGIAAGTYSATPLETLATGYLVTAADKAPGTNVVALLGYQASAFAAHFMHILSDYGSGFYFNGNKRRIDLPNVFTMGQAEGLCFRTAAYGYISNERFNNVITVEAKLRSFSTAAFTPPYVLPLQRKWVLRKNGALSFAMNATEADDYVFKLMSTDGKLVAQTAQRISTAGSFTLRFPQTFSGNELILVQMIGKKQRYANLVRVQD